MSVVDISRGADCALYAEVMFLTSSEVLLFVKFIM